MNYTEQEVREAADWHRRDGRLPSAGMLADYADLLAAQPVSESPLADFLRELHDRYPNWWAQFKSADLNKLDRLMLAAPAQPVAVPDGISFSHACAPLIKWLNENGHPHQIVVVTTSGAELLEGIQSIVNTEFIKD